MRTAVDLTAEPTTATPSATKPTTATPSATKPTTATPSATGVDGAEDALVEEELLVEEISIDGMCGVY